MCFSFISVFNCLYFIYLPAPAMRFMGDVGMLRFLKTLHSFNIQVQILIFRHLIIVYLHLFLVNHQYAVFQVLDYGLFMVKVIYVLSECGHVQCSYPPPMR